MSNVRNGYKMSNQRLKELQALDLETKIINTKEIIKEYYTLSDGNVYVAFSGGKDSVVLLDIVRREFPEVTAVFSNTGLEYPEIVSFVKSFDNVIILHPTMTFKEVLEKFGYPIISKKVARAINELKNPHDGNYNIRRLYSEGVTSKGVKAPRWKLAKKHRYLIDAPFKISDKCCTYLKKEPFRIFEKESKSNKIMGLMATDGEYRRNSILAKGMIVLNQSTKYCIPMAFWTRSDVLEYIKTRNLKYCKELYGEISYNGTEYVNDGCHGTGCMFCMFGVHLEKSPNRFQQMKITHPRLYEYCMENLGVRDILKYINVPYE